MIRVANAPVSYGAFELTVGRLPNVLGPDEVLEAISGADYEGTELGPPGYLGEPDALRERLERFGLELTGGYIPLRLSGAPARAERHRPAARPGHLAVAGGRPGPGTSRLARQDRLPPCEDARLDVLREAADMAEAWRRGVLCELGSGDVDLAAFFAELEAGGHSGWLVVEQDWVPGPDDDAAMPAAAQVRNRRWLAEHAGL